MYYRFTARRTLFAPRGVVAKNCFRSAWRKPRRPSARKMSCQTDRSGDLRSAATADDGRRLMAMTGDHSSTGEDAIWYFMATGIPINFGITILLGFVRRVAIRRPDVTVKLRT